jgi:Arc/MetJ family transcription regulator
MARTNIDLDEPLVDEVMRRYHLHSKREAVHFALQRLVGDPMTLEEALAMEGSGWEGDLDAMRRNRLEGLWP